MPTKPPKKKSPPTGPQAGAAPRKARRGAPRKGKRKKKKGLGMMAQVVGGATLLAVVAGLVGLSVYMAEQVLPKHAGPARTPNAMARPSIEPKLKGHEPKRPGWAVAPDDEVYDDTASDVDGKPIEPPVQGLLVREVLTVFADGKFRPDLPISRAEFANWCYNAVMAQSGPSSDPFSPPRKAFSRVEAAGTEFADVPADHWAANVIASLKAARLFGDKPDANFRPDAPLTREEWAMMASLFAASVTDRQAAMQPIGDQPFQVAYRLQNYTDFEAVKPSYRPWVAFVFGDTQRGRWLQEAFTPPDKAGPWHPSKPMTRGEAASWLGGVYDQVGKGIF